MSIVRNTNIPIAKLEHMAKARPIYLQSPTPVSKLVAHEIAPVIESHHSF